MAYVTLIRKVSEVGDGLSKETGFCGDVSPFSNILGHRHIRISPTHFVLIITCEDTQAARDAGSVLDAATKDITDSKGRRIEDEAAKTVAIHLINHATVEE